MDLEKEQDSQLPVVFESGIACCSFIIGLDALKSGREREEETSKTAILYGQPVRITFINDNMFRK